MFTAGEPTLIANCTGDFYDGLKWVIVSQTKCNSTKQPSIEDILDDLEKVSFHQPVQMVHTPEFCFENLPLAFVMKELQHFRQYITDVKIKL